MHIIFLEYCYFNIFQGNLFVELFLGSGITYSKRKSVYSVAQWDTGIGLSELLSVFTPSTAGVSLSQPW